MTDTEAAKMRRGELYLASDPELVAARIPARRLWQRFNATDPATAAAARALLGELLGALGVDAWVEAPFFCNYGTQITLGDGVFVNMNCVFLDPAPGATEPVPSGPISQGITRFCVLS
jgi:maltose O-acetyltransferase